MSGRTILGLLMTAALLGAPSSVSAATNELHDPAVTPPSGSTATVFTVSVRYDGTFEATAVTAEVAGLHLPMSLAEGTPFAGTWLASTLLPEGSWTLTITAAAERGNTASISGPTVTVSGASTPAPTPAGAGPNPPAGSSVSNAESPTGTLDAGPTPEPAPADSAMIASPEPASDEPAGAVQEGASPGAGEAATPAGGVPTGVAAGGNDQPAPVASEGGGPASDHDVLSRPTEDLERASHADGVDATTDGGVPGMLLAAFGVLAGITFIGTPVLVAARRRSPRTKEPLPAAADATAATLQRRTLRRARMRLDDDDPILASMGFGATEAEPPAGTHRASGRRPDRTPPT